MRLACSYRFGRLVTALVVVAVGVISLAAAFHSHPLAPPQATSTVLGSPGEAGSAGPAGCWACRLSHDRAPGVGVPPVVARHVDGPALTVDRGSPVVDSRIRGPKTPRAPPVS